ncbi:MAG: NAD-dependent epimerase/dehydratase family protein [Anaerolineae bacterium]|nr:NAD-dependent epimerase/dehydratase family protein [Anaerolineae bacterium]
MHVAIIGGTGHIGTYLVPELVERGHTVTVVSRGQRNPYQDHPAWKTVRYVTMDRQADEQRAEFGPKVRALGADVVVDLICFTEASARHLVEALRGHVEHFLHCGTIWIYGPSVSVPATEDQPRQPFGDYGIHKAAIEAYLLREARQNGFPATLLHPGHIVGPGWSPINPQGNLNLEVFERLAHGDEVLLPNLGMETLHHVHAADVAQSFVQAMLHWSTSVGESFHVVSPAALTLRGYAEAVAAHFGQPANLRYSAWEEFRVQVGESEARATYDHIAHSPNASIDKARRLIDYQPRYSSLQAVFEALDWLSAQGKISV